MPEDKKIIIEALRICAGGNANRCEICPLKATFHCQTKLMCKAASIIEENAGTKA